MSLVAAEAGGIGGRVAVRLPFRDREEAGRLLAQVLRSTSHPADAVVLGILAGGAVVGQFVAQALGLDFDVLGVQVLRDPLAPDPPAGAIADDGTVLVEPWAESILEPGQPLFEIDASRALDELRQREHQLRDGRPRVALRDRPVILIDEGVRTGMRMRVAIEAVRNAGASWVQVAVPVGSTEAIRTLRDSADDVLTLAAPMPFGAVADWYRELEPVPDPLVERLLSRTPTRQGKDEGG